MANPFVAEIRMFAGNFAPKGWALCNGQLMPISQNTALFSLLGTFYGGDGKTTFALPNLQGSAPMPNLWATTSGIGRGGGPPNYASTGNPAPMNPQAIGIAGSSQPHNNMSLYLAVTFIIALQGVFPPRS